MKKVPLWNSYKSLSAARAGGKHAIPLVPKITNFFKSQKRKRPVTGAGTKRSKSSIPQGRVMVDGSGGLCTYFNGRRGKSYLPPHVLNALPPQVAVTNNAIQLKSAVGKQNATTVLTLNKPIIATNYTSDFISRVVYDKATGDVTLNNIYLSNCYVIIYDCYARKDIGSNAPNSNVGDPLGAWIEGSSDEGSGAAYTFLGATPWSVEAFNQYWKVAQVTNVVLGAGQTCVHKVRLNPQRSISSAYAEYTGGAFKDLTYACMVEVHGSPANDSTTQTQVGVGVAGLNIIVDQEHTLKQIQKATPTISVTNNLITAFTVGEQVVNTGGSTIVAQAEG